MKTLWFMRHGDQLLDPDTCRAGVWQLCAQLSVSGRETLGRVRDTHLANRMFARHFTSPVLRARESALIVAARAKWTVLCNLGPHTPFRLDTLWMDRENPPMTARDVHAIWPDYWESEMRETMKAIPFALSSLADGEQALLITHQPMIGMLAAALDHRFNRWDESLPKGGIYKCEFSGGDTTTAEVTRIDPPK